MKRYILSAVVFVACVYSGATFAQGTNLATTIPNKATATTPGGTDYYILVQGGVLKKVVGNTVVRTGDSQTITNKTISCANNTCTVRRADLSDLGTNVGAALGNTLNGASGPIGALTPTNNNCVVGNGTAWTSASCPGGGSAWDITDGTHSVTSVADLTVGAGLLIGGSGGSATLDLVTTLNAQSGASYTILTSDGNKTVVMTNGSATTVTMVDAATAGAGFAFTLVCDAGCTVNRAGSDTINGANSLTLAAKEFAYFMVPASGTNFRAAVAPPSDPLNGSNISSGTVAVARGGTGLGSGTSGGVLAFTASGTLASSGALTANLPVIGGGAGSAPTVGTRSGNTTAYVTTTGAQTSGDCVKIDANGNHVANGSACGGGSGAVTLISTQTASASASLSWTGLTNTNYMLTCQSLIPATDAQVPYIQFGQGGTPTWKTTGYVWAMRGTTPGGTDLSGGSASDSGISWVSSTSGNVSEGISLNAYLYNLSETVKHTATYDAWYISAAGSHVASHGGGLYDSDTTAITGVRVIMGSGNLTSGSCSLYSVGT